jgi:hypothetical protein
LVSYRRRRKINPNEVGSKVAFVDEKGDSFEEYAVFHHKFITWLEVNGYDVEKTKHLPEDELKEIIKLSPFSVDSFSPFSVKIYSVKSIGGGVGGSTIGGITFSFLKMDFKNFIILNVHFKFYKLQKCLNFGKMYSDFRGFSSLRC